MKGRAERLSQGSWALPEHSVTTVPRGTVVTVTTGVQAIGCYASGLSIPLLAAGLRHLATSNPGIQGNYY